MIGNSTPKWKRLAHDPFELWQEYVDPRMAFIHLAKESTVVLLGLLSALLCLQNSSCSKYVALKKLTFTSYRAPNVVAQDMPPAHLTAQSSCLWLFKGNALLRRVVLDPRAL